MGTISPDDGAYGEVDVGGGYGLDLMKRVGYDPDILAIMEMNKEADALEANDELNIGAPEGVPEEEDDDMLDFSNPTQGAGSNLLGATFFDNVKNFLSNLEAEDFEGLKELGKEDGPESLGERVSLRGASDGLIRARGFRGMESPYAAPKYYSPQGSVEFQKMVSGLLSDVFKTNIRKPTIRSLI